jgi:hypothetical protein
LLSFTCVYFFESGLFNGLQAIQTKNFSPGLLSISHVLNGNRSRIGPVGRAQSVDCKFIARIADFANMSDQIFDLATDAIRTVVLGWRARLEPSFHEDAKWIGAIVGKRLTTFEACLFV